MRRRTKDRHLPPRVHRKHGAYYYVYQNKWTRLGTDLPSALANYARLAGSADDSIAIVLDRVLADAQDRCKPITVTQYRHAAERLKSALVEFRIDQLKPQHVAQLLDHYRHTPNMANRMRSVLKMACDLAVRTGLAESNPVTSIPRLRERNRDRYLTDDEYRAIHAAGSPSLRAIIDLCYLTAQRIGDVLAIKLRDLTAEGIEFDQQKTGKRLLVRWTPDLRRAVANAKKLHGPTTRIYLLGQRNGKIRKYGGVRDLFNKACRCANVENATLHDLRAKSITDAKRQGLDAQHLAGHTTEAMTVRYLRDKERDIVQGPALLK